MCEHRAARAAECGQGIAVIQEIQPEAPEGKLIGHRRIAARDSGDAHAVDRARRRGAEVIGPRHARREAGRRIIRPRRDGPEALVRRELPGGEGEETHFVGQTADEPTVQSRRSRADSETAHRHQRRRGGRTGSHAVRVERRGARLSHEGEMRPDIRDHGRAAEKRDTAEESLKSVADLKNSPAAGTGTAVVGQTMAAGSRRRFHPQFQSKIVRHVGQQRPARRARSAGRKVHRKRTARSRRRFKSHVVGISRPARRGQMIGAHGVPRRGVRSAVGGSRIALPHAIMIPHRDSRGRDQ